MSGPVGKAIKEAFMAALPEACCILVFCYYQVKDCKVYFRGYDHGKTLKTCCWPVSVLLPTDMKKALPL